MPLFMGGGDIQPLPTLLIDCHGDILPFVSCSYTEKGYLIATLNRQLTAPLMYNARAVALCTDCGVTRDRTSAVRQQLW